VLLSIALFCAPSSFRPRFPAPSNSALGSPPRLPLCSGTRSGGAASDRFCQTTEAAARGAQAAQQLGSRGHSHSERQLQALSVRVRLGSASARRSVVRHLPRHQVPRLPHSLRLGDGELFTVACLLLPCWMRTDSHPWLVSACRCRLHVNAPSAMRRQKEWRRSLLAGSCRENGEQGERGWRSQARVPHSRDRRTEHTHTHIHCLQSHNADQGLTQNGPQKTAKTRTGAQWWSG
jgi:hypothetical protein